MDSRKVLSFPARSAIQPSVSIHHDLWTDTIRPTDSRDLRLDKIAALRAAVAVGTYRVSSADLAEKLIHHIRGNA